MNDEDPGAPAENASTAARSRNQRPASMKMHLMNATFDLLDCNPPAIA